MITSEQAEHNSQNVYYRSTVGAMEAGGEVSLGIRLRTEEKVRKVLLRIWQEGLGEKIYTMRLLSSGSDQFYSVRVLLPENGCVLWYYFILDTAEGTRYYGNNADMLGGIGSIYDHVPPSYQITVYDKGAKTPDWIKHAVMYQIFPDRFYKKGEQLPQKKNAVIHSTWEDEPFYFKDPDTKEIVAYDFFGGNLAGLKEKLTYIKEMGFSVIYLNPVFEAESNHRYDTGDYHKIDPILGTNEEFQDFVATAKAMGIRIIIDGVFSHTGSNSKYFNRKGEYESIGAYQSKDSRYYEWYNFRRFPNEYDCWWDFNTLPNVKETTPSYLNYIIHDSESVLHHWMRQGVSGWRLDVIDELPAAFSQAFFKELKETDSEAVLIGEVWEDASNKVAYGVPREYLSGHEMDSAMNYPLRKQLLDYLLSYIDGARFMQLLENQRENYPKENFYAMMNLIGSHDVERALTLLGEAPFYQGMPAIDQSRARLDDDHHNIGIARLLMAAMFQMSYPGVPCVYYGDEIGMQGFKDPYNRRPYDWQNGDTFLRGWYQKYIAERNANTVLQTGEFLPLYAARDTVAYARLIRNGRDVFGKPAESGAYIAIFNRNARDAETVKLDVADFAYGEFVDAFDAKKTFPVERGFLTIKVPPLKSYLLRRKKEERKYGRGAGVLLHPTSLPSRFGIGDLGREAYQFVDYLHEAGQSIWQILPLNPVGETASPYQSPSAFAGNPMLISLDDVVARGLLTEADIRIVFEPSTAFVEFDRVWAFKKKCLKKAYANFRAQAGEDADDYRAFCRKENDWLEEYALFMAVKSAQRAKAWMAWEEALKKRDPKAITKCKEVHAEEIGFEKFLQYLFAEQWAKLHAYAGEKGVQILGDLPIFIAQDSADVWANQKLFDLDEEGHPNVVAGVPPDYFSATGQLWGNPHYRWEVMKKDGYAWWIARFRHLFELVDMVRVDHFRGFESYWEVDGKAKTAINGRWVKGPGIAFFDRVREALGDLPIVAEDLGVITDKVEELREACGFPGMKILQFTLHLTNGGRLGFVAPENSIVYTGTHDNNTTLGWFEEELDHPTKAAVANLIDANPLKGDDVCKKMVEFAYASDARIVITPMQDILGLDARKRMNTPGTVGMNWKWRMKAEYQESAEAKRLCALAMKYERKC